ncbi:hypothetical protein FPOA_03851 [Fusarium poae]|uniref:Uncharacterized protein n=1 Tax=Fusarium poae TaxID=36050 RepID=A0A1B8ARX9_FUSPO|nr:hypothetical protein FPOA_03851 [Fusarium poae]
MSTSAQDIGSQWANPGDILSILLLIGSDIVQAAITQLVGYRIRIPGTKTHIPITPVAFSFGWATYSFTNLLAAVGSMKLVPETDCPSIVVNCSNGFVRHNRSWVLGRILRDHEIHNSVDPRPISEGGRAESIRIDIFHLNPALGPQCDLIWWFGWATLLIQLIIVILPGILYNDWVVLVVALAGMTLVAITCSLPQWIEEKWGTPSFSNGGKVTCLTKGNGHLHLMVFIASAGSWDLERLATYTPVPRTETRWISVILSMLWVCLLISISGLKRHTWFLIAAGGLGMLQNVSAAGISRHPTSSNFHLTKFSHAPTIIGRRECYKDDPSPEVNLEEDIQGFSDVQLWVSQGSDRTSHRAQRERAPMPSWVSSMAEEDGAPKWLATLKPTLTDRITDTRPKSLPSSLKTLNPFTSRKSDQDKIIYASGVQGALVELEKWVPKAGLSMLPIFFPGGGLQFHDDDIRGNKFKKFWKRAYHTRTIRKRAEEKRRSEEKKTGVLLEV